MDEKVAGGADSKLAEKKAHETGAEAPESPQEQSGLAVLLSGQLIQLSVLGVQDFPLIDIITGGTPASVLDRSKAKFSLIGSVLSRSKLTPEQVEILKLDPLGTYKAVSAVITQELFGSDA
jgi:hypothetical protein